MIYIVKNNQLTTCKDDYMIRRKDSVYNAYSALQGLWVIWKMYDAEKHGVIADLRGLGVRKAKLPEL